MRLIDELAETEKKLEETIEKCHYQNLDEKNFFELAEVALIFLDKELKIRKFSPNTKEYLNVSGKMIGEPIEPFLEILNIPTIFEQISLVPKTGKLLEIDFKNEVNERFILKVNPYLDEFNQANGLLITIINIDDLVTPVDNLSTIFDFSQLGMVIVDPKNGDVIRINHGLSQMLGYEVFDLLNKSIDEITCDADRSSIRELLINSQTNNKGYVVAQKRLLDKNNQIVWCRIHFCRFNQDGRVLSHILVEDISRQVEKIEELEFFHEIAMDRELKMIELKKEVNELLFELNKDKRYEVDALEGDMLILSKAKVLTHE